MSNTKEIAYLKVSIRPEFIAWSCKFAALCIYEGEIKKLFFTFAIADIDGNGTIELIELLTAIDLERTRFSERVFAIFDDDNSGKCPPLAWQRNDGCVDALQGRVLFVACVAAHEAALLRGQSRGQTCAAAVLRQRLCLSCLTSVFLSRED